jgi:hypothetical protein
MPLSGTLRFWALKDVFPARLNDRGCLSEFSVVYFKFGRVRAFLRRHDIYWGICSLGVILISTFFSSNYSFEFLVKSLSPTHSDISSHLQLPGVYASSTLTWHTNKQIRATVHHPYTTGPRTHLVATQSRIIEISHVYNRNQAPTKMLFTRGFSLTNFVIGSSALCFQIFVLYPWHEKLDEEFTELKKEHARLLEDTRERHRDELKGIREQLELLNAKNSKSGKFW